VSVALKIAERVAYSHLGKPYVWGGDSALEGFDCSGLVIEILKSVGILPLIGDWTAAGLWRHFQDCVTVAPQLGCLVFWGDSTGRIRHIEFCLTSRLSLGASGGGSANTPPDPTGDPVVDRLDRILFLLEGSGDDDAYIKIRPFDTRPGVVGFVDPFRRLAA
jgi:hypothetical protein